MSYGKGNGQRMERLEFIEKVFTLYRVNPENNRDLVLIYDDAFSVNKPIDWDKLYKRVLNTAEGGLPKPGWFVSQFDGCLKNNDYLVPDGLKVRLVLTDYVYEFETCQLNKTLEEMKLKAMRKFKDKFRSFELLDESNPIIEDEYGHKSYNWHAI